MLAQLAQHVRTRRRAQGSGDGEEGEEGEAGAVVLDDNCSVSLDLQNSCDMVIANAIQTM